MREVLDAARESFGAYAPRFDRPPLRVHVMAGEGSGGVPPAPVLRGQRHLLMWVSDQENFAVIDRRERFGYSCVTRATLADRVFFRWHFLDALIYMLLELNYITSLHGACVAWEGAGVLLYGESGVGKSTLSYACARRGWTYISDDASSVVWGGGRTVIGEPHHFRFRAEAPDLFPELRGRTVGRELDRKPTIEVFTRGPADSHRPECRVEHIAFLDRRPGLRAGITRVGKKRRWNACNRMCRPSIRSWMGGAGRWSSRWRKRPPSNCAIRNFEEAVRAALECRLMAREMLGSELSACGAGCLQPPSSALLRLPRRSASCRPCSRRRKRGLRQPSRHGGGRIRPPWPPA